ncbi:MAG: sensor histidine kinase [Chloroflexota bacterium]|nr:sensor histidine kinase [Chloroflexota bacterium]
MRSLYPRWLRWFFLLWLVVLYSWGFTGIIAGSWKDLMVPCMKQQGDTSSAVVCSSLVFLAQAVQAHLERVSLLTLLICCSACLFWISLSWKKSALLCWLTLPCQLGLAFGIALVVQQNDSALILCLALTLQAIALLKQPRSISIASCGSLLFLILILETRPQQWNEGWLLAMPNPLWLPSVGDVFGVLALVLFLVGYFILHVQHIQAHSQLTAAHQQLAATHAQLQFATTRIEELSRLTERRRLARELHDTLVQGVAGLVMQIQAAQTYVLAQHYAQVSAMLEHMKTSARETLTTARAAIHDLRTMTTSEELYEAVCGEIERLTLATNIHCLPTQLDLLTMLPVSACEQVLSMLRESFTNIVKHAQAQHLWIRLFQQQDCLTIEIQDDGRGFRPDEHVDNTGHYGLLGLRERTRLLGGSCQIESAPGQGTLLRLCIPGEGREERVHE